MAPGTWCAAIGPDPGGLDTERFITWPWGPYLGSLGPLLNAIDVEVVCDGSGPLNEE